MGALPTVVGVVEQPRFGSGGMEVHVAREDAMVL